MAEESTRPVALPWRREQIAPAHRRAFDELMAAREKAVKELPGLRDEYKRAAEETRHAIAMSDGLYCQVKETEALIEETATAVDALQKVSRV